MGATIGPTSSFLHDNITLVHATCNSTHQLDQTITPIITASIEAFRKQPSPLRVVVISSPQVAFAITDRIANMPQEGITLEGNTIYIFPAHVLNVVFTVTATISPKIQMSRHWR
jgi:hypothetical protein